MILCADGHDTMKFLHFVQGLRNLWEEFMTFKLKLASVVSAAATMVAATAEPVIKVLDCNLLLKRCFYMPPVVWKLQDISYNAEASPW